MITTQPSRLFWLIAIIAITGKASAQELYSMPKGQQSRVSSFENLNGLKGEGGKTNLGAKGNAFESLKAGESKTLLNIQSAGVIQRIWLTINDRTPTMLRSLRLRMYWDGADKPAVDVPLGDFFCAGLGRPVAFQSALFTNPEGRSFNSYIPMPFKKGAKVVLTNEGSADLNLLFLILITTCLPKPRMTSSISMHAGTGLLRLNWERILNCCPQLTEKVVFWG